MSLYNLLFGKNPSSDVLLAILGLRENDVERFRDCGFDETGIFIYTRTGGGNREDYPNAALTSSPYYLGDEDDDFDSTYATYRFKFPDEVKDDCEAFKNVRENGISGKLVQWVVKTLEREPTENDKRAAAWKAQREMVGQATALRIFETNGHTVVPIDDQSLEILLQLTESVGGQELCYSVLPYKLEVAENVNEYSFSNGNRCRVLVRMPKEWQIDRTELERWKTLFGEKYPLSMKAIEERASELR